MKRLLLLLAVMGTIAAIAAPAPAQTLADRIAAVRKKRAEQARREATTGLQAEILQALLYRKVTLDLEEAPARDVFTAFKDLLGINIIVRYSDDRVGHGIDPQTPVTLNAEDVFAIDFLEQVLGQCAVVEECTWQLRKGFLEVGTKERLAVAAAREMRTYPIQTLIYEAPDFTDAPTVGFEHDYGPWGGGWYGGGYPWYGRGYSGGILAVPARRQTIDRSINSDERKAQRAQQIIDLIIDFIEPRAWPQNGGDWATIRYIDGALLVRAPDFIHRQIGGYPRVPPPRQAKEAEEAEEDRREDGASNGESRPKPQPPARQQSESSAVGQK